jgi:hypothetical protein
MLRLGGVDDDRIQNQEARMFLRYLGTKYMFFRYKATNYRAASSSSKVIVSEMTCAWVYTSGAFSVPFSSKFL